MCSKYNFIFGYEFYYYFILDIYMLDKTNAKFVTCSKVILCVGILSVPLIPMFRDFAEKNNIYVVPFSYLIWAAVGLLFNVVLNYQIVDRKEASLKAVK